MKCEIEFFRSRDDGSSRSSFGAKINSRMQNARQTLTDCGWECEVGGAVIRNLKATIRISEIMKRGETVTNAMSSIATHLLSSIE